MKIAVCLEAGNHATGAFVPDYPGCWVLGRTKESALKKVRIAIIDWFRWASEHGESLKDTNSDVEIEVSEMLGVNYNPAEAGKPEPIFWSEISPIGKEDIERTIRLMDYSRQDLLALVRNATRDTLEWEPPGKPRTILNCLTHIAHVELWYITRLNIELPGDYPTAVFELLDSTRAAVIECLQNFPRSKMRGIFQPRKYKSPVCDLWTARKVLRRLVDHERLHTRYIKTILDMYANR